VPVGSSVGAAATAVATNLGADAGKIIELRVVAKNNVTTQRGEPSAVIKLTPSALPSASTKIEITAETNYAATWLLLEWPEPADTGAGNPMISGAVKVPIL